MNKLVKWLEKQNSSMAHLAKVLGVSGALLSRALNGVQPLGIGTCENIHRLTEGEVSLKHLNPELYKKYKSYKCLEV